MLVYLTLTINRHRIENDLADARFAKMADEIFLIDTSVISNASKRRPHPAISAWLAQQARLAIPFPVILEMEAGTAELHRRDPQKAAALRNFVDDIFETEPDYPPMTPAVARLLGEMMCCRPLSNLWISSSIGRKPGQDLAIAAVSIINGMPLATLNNRDFELIDDYFELPGVYNPAFDLWVVPRTADRMAAQFAMTAH